MNVIMNCANSCTKYFNQQPETIPEPQKTIELNPKPFTLNDIKQGHLSPKQIESLQNKDQVKLVPPHQINFLHEEVVEKGFLSKNQYKNLSNPHLIKRVPGNHIHLINPKSLKDGQISMLAIDYIRKKSQEQSNEFAKAYKIISHKFPQETKKICARINSFGQIKDPKNIQYEKEIEIFQRVRCKKNKRYFNSSFETHPYFTYYRDIDMKERPLAIIFKAHENTDYNGALKDTKIANERLLLLSKYFNIEQYTIGFKEEIIEILETTRDQGKRIRFSLIKAHGHKTCLALGCNPEDPYSECGKNVVSDWKTTTKRFFKFQNVNSFLWLDEANPVIQAYQLVLDHKSFVSIEACKSENFAKKFSSMLDNTVVFGCQDTYESIRFSITSANPNHLSFSLIKKDKTNPNILRERIAVFRGNNRSYSPQKNEDRYTPVSYLM